MAHRPSLIVRIWHGLFGTTPETRGRRDYWPYGVQTQRAREERAKIAAARAEAAATKKRAKEIAAETMKAMRAHRSDAALVKRIAAKEQRATQATAKSMARDAANAVLLELRGQKAQERAAAAEAKKAAATARAEVKAAKTAARDDRNRFRAAVTRTVGAATAKKVAAGEIKGDELRALMKSGALSFKKNPAAMKLLARLRPTGKKELAQALTVAREFHGPGQTAAVVELSDKERVKPPRFAVVIGELESVAYVPPNDSERAGAVWEHQSGDRGPFDPASDKRPILAADPVTKRPFIVQDGSPMRLDPDAGLVG